MFSEACWEWSAGRWGCFWVPGSHTLPGAWSWQQLEPWSPCVGCQVKPETHTGTSVTCVQVKPHFSCQKLTLTFNLPLVFHPFFFSAFPSKPLHDFLTDAVPGTIFSFPVLGSHKSGSCSLISPHERTVAKVISELCWQPEVDPWNHEKMQRDYSTKFSPDLHTCALAPILAPQTNNKNSDNNNKNNKSFRKIILSAIGKIQIESKDSNGQSKKTSGFLGTLGRTPVIPLSSNESCIKIWVLTRHQCREMKWGAGICVFNRRDYVGFAFLLALQPLPFFPQESPLSVLLVSSFLTLGLSLHFFLH